MRDRPSPEIVLCAAGHFDLGGEVRESRPYGSGHIHDTFLVSLGTKERRFILQRLNVPPMVDPVVNVQHVHRVLDHLRGKVEDPRRRLTAVAASDGKGYWQDGEGVCWRMFDFIEGTVTRDVVETPEQAYEAAKAFGRFLHNMKDLSPRDLGTLMPYFHDTPKRLLRLESVAAADELHRAKDVQSELDFAFDRKESAGVLTGFFERGEIPERVVHNDTKVNNVLFDAGTGEGLCVVDLDTVMPGLALYDFGDLVRSSASDSAEDERDLDKVALRMPVFEALARGFLESTEGLLSGLEREQMAFSAKLITYELGVRFLTDYLTGDVYFKTSREGQNLDRCRAQFALVRDIEKKESEMRRAVLRVFC